MELKAQRFFGGGMVNSPSQKAGEAANCGHLDKLEAFFPLLKNLDFYPKQEVKMKSLNLAGAGEVGAVGGGGGEGVGGVLGGGAACPGAGSVELRPGYWWWWSTAMAAMCSTSCGT